MQRDIAGLSSKQFDIAVIGGGIYGACVAWEAASRGLSVALVEKNDFSWATSANSLKTIHGGFRYLQNMDLARIRESVVERRNLMYMAPHLVHPLPVLVPAYGHSMRGLEALSAGLLAYEVLSADRNRLSDPSKYIPSGRRLSTNEVLERLPGIPKKGLSGGIVFYDAQVYNSERLVIAFLEAASRAGACLANYAEVTGLLLDGGQVTGLVVMDRESGLNFQVRSRLVINCAGPWANCITAMAGKNGSQPVPGLARAVNVIVPAIFDDYAVGLPGKNNYQVNGAANKTNLLFVSPWRGYSVAGTLYTPHNLPPDQLNVTGGELRFLLQQLNQAYPPADLSLENITFVHVGLLPLTEAYPQQPAFALDRRYHIIDHRREGRDGLWTVVGVKYTTARDVAQKVITRALIRLNKPFRRSVSAKMRLPGGEIEDFNRFADGAVDSCPQGLPAHLVRSLVHNYGSEYPRVLACFDPHDSQGQSLPGDLALLRAEVLHAVRFEMAVKLADVVLRRTELGSAARPARSVLQLCASEMARELGWDEARITREIEEVERIYHWNGRES